VGDTRSRIQATEAMEKAHHDSFSVSKRVSFIDRGDGTSSNTDDEEQLADGEDLLKCFSPFFNSMRLFGLYFTRESRRIHDASRSTTVTTDSPVPRKWNGGRIYAGVMTVVAWLNVARMASVFEKSDKFGLILLLKLATTTTGLFSASLQTACFVACQTGKLDGVFRGARILKSDITRYRRLAVIHTIVCWVLWVTDILLYFVPLFIVYKDMNTPTSPFGVHVTASEEQLILAKAMTVVIFIFADFAWFSSYSVNYIYCSKVLHCMTSDQKFHLLVSTDFTKMPATASALPDLTQHIVGPIA